MEDESGDLKDYLMQAFREVKGLTEPEDGISRGALLFPGASC